MVDIYGEGGIYGDRPPNIEEQIYGPLEEKSLMEVQADFPGAFNIDPEALDAIDRGEKTLLQIKEERAQSLGMTLREYIGKELDAENKASWNRGMLAGVHPRTGEPLPQGSIEPPKTERYGYGLTDAKAIFEKSTQMKYGDKPPENWKVPDYSPEGRVEFEDWVFKKIGGNPFTFNVQDELEKATQSNVRDWFNQAFRGQVRYEDRHKMNNKQKQHWQDQLNRGRAFIESDLNVQQRAREFNYNRYMNGFDNRAKLVAEELKKQDKRNSRIVKMTKDGREISVRVDEVAEHEALGWTEGTGIRTPTVGDYIRHYDFMVEALDPSNLKNGKVDPRTLETINNMNEVLGLPPILEFEEEVPSDVNWLTKWWKDNAPGVITTYETQAQHDTKKGPVVKTKSDMAETKTGTNLKPTAVDESGTPYPEGTTGSYQGRPTVVRNGQWVFA